MRPYNPFKRAPRYGPKNRQNCLGGCRGMNPDVPRSHDSREEARYCDELRLLRRAGEIRHYTSQVIYHLHDRAGRAVGWMRVDFDLVLANGRQQIREYKGKLFGTLMEYRQKKALFSWCYPKIDYVTVGKGQIVI